VNSIVLKAQNEVAEEYFDIIELGFTYLVYQERTPPDAKSTSPVIQFDSGMHIK